MRERLERLHEMGWPLWVITITAAMACGAYMAFDTPGAAFTRSVFKAVACTFALFLAVSIIKGAILAGRKRG